MQSKETITQGEIPLWPKLQLYALDFYCQLCDRCLTLLRRGKNSQSVEEQMEEVKRELGKEGQRGYTDSKYLHQPMTY